MEYNQVLKELRKEDHSILSRVKSILYDSRYVETFSRFPRVANERCGLWYISPQQSADSAYFKSTDGHTGQWMFSLRRLNFHILPLFKKSSSIVLVDSTRKGKLMPDAMSKTVPIWCAVLNYIMFEDEEGEEWKELKSQNWLITPRVMVSENEHSSIVKKIPEHASAVRKLGLISKESLVEKLGAKKPLVPCWMYPGKTIQTVVESPDYFTVCCLTASIKATPQTLIPNWNHSIPYVQGAADDHELWASKEVCEGRLDHKLLWEHIYVETEPELSVVDRSSGTLHTWLTEEEFISRINQIYRKSEHLKPESNWETSRLGTTGILCGKVSGDVSLSEVEKIHPSIKSIIVLSEKYTLVDVPEKCSQYTFSALIESNKKGSKKLRDALPKIIQGLDSVNEDKGVLVLCDSGADISVAVVLCILCRFFDLDWNPTMTPPHVNKDVIKQHLSTISNYQKCNPSRNTLQSVNTCLIQVSHIKYH